MYETIRGAFMRDSNVTCVIKFQTSRNIRNSLRCGGNILSGECEGDGCMSSPAFPVIGHSRGADDSGMTLRDYFAAKALQGLISKGAFKNIEESEGIKLLCKQAYKFSNGMLEEREKP